ncbi:ribosomal protein S5 domain 2-like protein [Coniophora puteana RWD-64-598 SS2]|uniref:Ribosomal protein S5 domain 2-like protein n=1 Tax=Coniophora puteana (strain RWD-64-598) TaxID=741705 RepID=A0A5M3N182_CONPW|nr:ribosomal protein S5 domain 2-like protein [Coniophora puteana RWD-64-598 SS2]EIW85160.1 ribosomal protein S5 domain 2-like protein [Coniophora puteana RWD-64-598 SS2]
MAQAGFDRRRINGPEESFPPQYEDTEEPSWTLGQPRQDRAASDIRPIFLQTGFISQANGSAYVETAKTKLACAIYGPRQNKASAAYSEHGRLNVEVKFAPFSYPRRKAPLRDAEDRTIAETIHQALASSVRLELLPKSTIDVFITILESDGIEGCTATASTAASAALADAGIEILGLVTACSAAIIGEEIWLDPTEAESKQATGSVSLAYLPALDRVTTVFQSGQMDVSMAIRCMEQCQLRCKDIHTIVAQSLLDSHKP